MKTNSTNKDKQMTKQEQQHMHQNIKPIYMLSLILASQIKKGNTKKK